MIDDEIEHSRVLEETGFWGRRGAGCLVYARSTGRFMIALRSLYVLEPQTWGTWGGAVPEGMGTADSALRELFEETGFDGVESMVPVHVFHDAITGFSYENFIAVIADEFDPVLNWENDGFAWVAQGEWPNPLHFGLADLIANVSDLSSVVSVSAKHCPA